jgi:hypothetical protein
LMLCRSRGPGFDSRQYHIFREVVGLEWGPLSLVSTIEELLGRNSSGFSLEIQEYSCGDPLRWPCDTLCPQNWLLTSPTSRGCFINIACLRTKATESVSAESAVLDSRKWQWERVLGMLLFCVCRSRACKISWDEWRNWGTHLEDT